MHDDPRTDATDPADLTQRHSIEPGEPVAAAPVTPPSPEAPVPTDPYRAPSDTWTTPASAEGQVPLDRFTPAPEPRSEWARSWEQTPPVTPERWYEPAPAAVPTTAASPAPETGRSRGRGGSLVAVSLLSAVLAAGGTVLALGATGALDRPVVSTTSVPLATNAGTTQPVTIDESSATIAVAAKVSPAVVRITVTGSANSGTNGVIPETGVGSGVIFDSNGWILTNHHVVAGRREVRRRAQGRARSCPARSTASTR